MLLIIDCKINNTAIVKSSAICRVCDDKAGKSCTPLADKSLNQKNYCRYDIRDKQEMCYVSSYKYIPTSLLRYYHFINLNLFNQKVKLYNTNIINPVTTDGVQTR